MEKIDLKFLRPKVIYNFMYEDKNKKDDVIKRIMKCFHVKRDIVESALYVANILDLIKEDGEFLIANVGDDLI